MQKRAKGGETREGAGLDHRHPAHSAQDFELGEQEALRAFKGQ